MLNPQLIRSYYGDFLQNRLDTESALEFKDMLRDVFRGYVLDTLGIHVSTVSEPEPIILEFINNIRDPVKQTIEAAVRLEVEDLLNQVHATRSNGNEANLTPLQRNLADNTYLIEGHIESLANERAAAFMDMCAEVIQNYVNESSGQRRTSGPPRA